MPFISESIPENERSKISPEMFRHKAQRLRLELIDRWTIDREREVVLIPMGSGMGKNRPDRFAMIFNGMVINIEAFSRFDEDSTGIDLFWELVRIDIYGELEKSRDEILKVALEAFEAFEWTRDMSQVESITVKISC